MYLYETMTAKIVKCSVVVIALLVLSAAIAQGCDVDSQMLLGLFETALVNDSDTLQTLQEIYYNPNSKQSPENVCLSIFIAVDTIANPDCPCGRDGPAFDGHPGEWYFDSYFELQQQVADDASDTSELAKLITRSGSNSIFYAMDPSFFSIVKTSSNFIALDLPLFDYYGDDYGEINITIHTKLDDMPCWDDAVYALRSVLMWVSFNYQQKLCNFIHALH